MKVLQLDLGRSLRGGQRQVLYLMQHLVGDMADAGFVPVLACPANAPLTLAAANLDVHTHPLPGAKPWNPLVIAALFRFIQKEGVDIIHTHDAHAALLGALAVCRFPHIKLVHSRRVSYPVHGNRRLWKYRKADMVIGVSQDISNTLVASGLSPQQVKTVHSGIDPQTYTPKKARNDNIFRFLAIGACTPQKGFAVLVEAAAHLHALPHLPDWRVDIVGDGELKDALGAQLATHELTNRVYMPGRLESREVLPTCDVLVVPSIDGEGSSGVIKEGWATGIPVIASNLSSNTELVQHEYNGLLAQTHNAQALAHAMLRCLTDAPLCERLVRGGYETLPAFTDSRMAAATVALYHELCMPKQGRVEHKTASNSCDM